MHVCLYSEDQFSSDKEVDCQLIEDTIQRDPQDARDDCSLKSLTACAVQSSGMLEANDAGKISDRSASTFLDAEYLVMHRDWSDDEVAVVRRALRSSTLEGMMKPWALSSRRSRQCKTS